jgi:hypothetical protein
MAIFDEEIKSNGIRINSNFCENILNELINFYDDQKFLFAKKVKKLF